MRSTWETVAKIQDDAARLFYGRLFEIDPSTRALFASVDMAKQGEKFMRTITTTVAKLECPDILLPGLEALGRRHAGYGTKEGHYESVGAALFCGRWGKFWARSSRPRPEKRGPRPTGRWRAS